MSVLSDHSLRLLYPDAESVGPASIDLHLGDTLLWWPDWITRDPRVDQSGSWRELTTSYAIGDDWAWVLEPGTRYLGVTRERIEIRPDCAGQIGARSSWGRDGLAVIQGPAGWCDPGYEGHPTLELSVIGSRLIVWPGAAICQLIIHRLTTPCEQPYRGRYQGDAEPVSSRLHLETAR